MFCFVGMEDKFYTFMYNFISLIMHYFFKY